MRRSFAKLLLSPQVIEWERSLRFGTENRFEPEPISDLEGNEIQASLNHEQEANNEFEVASEMSFTDEEEDESDEEIKAQEFREQIPEHEAIAEFSDPDLGLELLFCGEELQLVEEGPLDWIRDGSETLYFYDFDEKVIKLDRSDIASLFSEDEIPNEYLSPDNLQQEASNFAIANLEPHNANAVEQGPIFLSELKNFIPSVPVEQRNCVVAYNLPLNYAYGEEFSLFGILLGIDTCVLEEHVKRNYAYFWYANHIQAQDAVNSMHNKKVQDEITKKFKPIRCWRLYDFDDDFMY